MGVSNPPQFATRKMKKTTMCAVRRRLLLARSSGRIKRTEAPVVPRTLASTAPSPSIPVFTSGVPESEPWTWIPPVITYSAPITTMNPRYSWSFSSNTARPGSPSAIPSCHSTGSETTTATRDLLRFGCHQRGEPEGEGGNVRRVGLRRRPAVPPAVVVGRGVRRRPRGWHRRRREGGIVEGGRVVHHRFSAQRLHTMDVGDPRPVRPRVGAGRGLQLPVTHDVLPVARDAAVARHVARERGGRLELGGGERAL